jgi:hypothetical protein
MYKLSKRSYSNLDGVKSILIAILTEGIKESPYDLGIPSDGGVRTDEKQIELYARGRTTEALIKKGIKGVEGKPERSKVTWTLNSLHKPHEIDGMGYAFDIYAYVNGGASWDMKYLKPIAEHLKKVAKEVFNIDLQWGYDLWKKDGAHFQISQL